jgi:hypothetical protein
MGSSLPFVVGLDGEHAQKLFGGGLREVLALPRFAPGWVRS